jgi:hypothetical protein
MKRNGTKRKSDISHGLHIVLCRTPSSPNNALLNGYRSLKRLQNRQCEEPLGVTWFKGKKSTHNIRLNGISARSNNL